jgi:excisionase family DNA binding protein
MEMSIQNNYPQIGIVNIDEILSQQNKLSEQKKMLEIQLTEQSIKVYTFEEAMNFLCMSKSTLHRKVRDRKIHFVQSGPYSRITFKKSHLLEYLDRNTKGPYSSIGNPLLRK